MAGVKGKSGRKKSEQEMVKTSIYIPRTSHEKMQRIAEKNSKPVTAQARDLLEESLARY